MIFGWLADAARPPLDPITTYNSLRALPGGRRQRRLGSPPVQIRDTLSVFVILRVRAETQVEVNACEVVTDRDRTCYTRNTGGVRIVNG